MNIFDWMKKRKQPHVGSPASPAKNDVPITPSENKTNTTSVERPDFSMVLPFRWISVPCDEGYEFRNQVLPEQLIVTVVRTQRKLEMPELKIGVEHLIKSRTSAIAKLSSGLAKLGKPIHNENEQACETRVFGIDESQNIKLAFVARGTPEKVVTAALTRYSLENVLPFEIHAGLIFDFLKIK